MHFGETSEKWNKGGKKSHFHHPKTTIVNIFGSLSEKQITSSTTYTHTHTHTLKIKEERKKQIPM